MVWFGVMCPPGRRTGRAGDWCRNLAQYFDQPMPGCLDEDRFAALLDGHLSPPERAEALDHINGCPACGMVWREMARALAPAGPAPEPVEQPPPSLLGGTFAGF